MHDKCDKIDRYHTPKLELLSVLAQTTTHPKWMQMQITVSRQVYSQNHTNNMSKVIPECPKHKR